MTRTERWEMTIRRTKPGDGMIWPYRWWAELVDDTKSYRFARREYRRENVFMRRASAERWVKRTIRNVERSEETQTSRYVNSDV